MMAVDAASIQTQPAMLEDIQDEGVVRPYFVQISAQGIQVINVHPEWTWQVEPVKKLLEFLSLPENWNSYGGRPPSLDTVLSAIDFLTMVPFDTPPRLRVIPLSGGGVQLEWSSDQRELEVEFQPEGSIVFLKAEAITEGEEGELRALTPTHVKSLMSWLIAG